MLRPVTIRTTLPSLESTQSCAGKRCSCGALGSDSGGVELRHRLGELSLRDLDDVVDEWREHVDGVRNRDPDRETVREGVRPITVHRRACGETPGHHGCRVRDDAHQALSRRALRENRPMPAASAPFPSGTTTDAGGVGYASRCSVAISP